MSENNILGVILAGGKSSRFGSDKSLIKLGNKTLLEHTIFKIEKNFPELLIVSNNNKIKFSKKNIFVIKDCLDGHLGPLVGVLSAMKWIENNKKNYNWIATFPCDSPFFNTRLIYDLIKEKEKSNKKLYFFKSREKRHNIFGLWSLDLIDILQEDISNNYRKVETWADKIGSKVINITDDKFDSFLNINTKEEFEEAKKNLDKI